MFAAKIENGVVVNVGKLAPGQPVPNGWVKIDKRIGKGWAYDGRDFTPPAREEQPEREEPPQVKGARQAAVAKLEAATGMTIAEIRMALGG